MYRVVKGWYICSESWVGMTLIFAVPLSCPAGQPLLPISHQPNQNQAEGGTPKIKVNPTQLSEQMDHPVHHIFFKSLSLFQAAPRSRARRIGGPEQIRRCRASDEVRWRQTSIFYSMPAAFSDSPISVCGLLLHDGTGGQFN